jgi:hypothetical protein
VSGVTAIGQPPLINMMAGKARPLSSLSSLVALASRSALLLCWRHVLVLIKLVSDNKVI